MGHKSSDHSIHSFQSFHSVSSAVSNKDIKNYALNLAEKRLSIKGEQKNAEVSHVAKLINEELSVHGSGDDTEFAPD